MSVLLNGALAGDVVVNMRGEPRRAKNMKYRKKPVVIEAVQLTQYSLDELYSFLGITNKGSFLDCGHGIDPTDGQFKITTLEGVHIANINDYIIRGVKGEFYPCKPDIFEMTYEKAEDAPKTEDQRTAHNSAMQPCQATNCNGVAEVHLCRDCFDSINGVVRLPRLQ